MQNHDLVDLAENLPQNLLLSIGEITVLFGRLEHMAFLALKRKTGMSLDDAHDKYTSYSLGAKLFGKKPCKGVGEKCVNYGGAQGLSDFSNEICGLKELCTDLQKLTATRNRIMHGLFTTVADEAAVIHKNQAFSVVESGLKELKLELVKKLKQLNTLVPVPGMNVTFKNEDSLEVSYNYSTVTSLTPLFTIFKENENA